MTNQDSILEIRAITLPTKVCLVKVIVFFFFFPVSSHIYCSFFFSLSFNFTILYWFCHILK